MRNWRWHLLPEEEQGRLIEAHNSQDFATVREILNAHRVAPGMLAACCSLEVLLSVVPWAIANEKIGANNEKARSDIG